MNPFWWGVGIENTSMPDLGVNELFMTRHQDHWQQDLLRAKRLGVQFIRYGLPWDMQHPEKDRFDWMWTDQVMVFLAEIELEVVWDLVHFGTPSWLENGFLNPEYPAEIARYAKAFAQRYPQVQRYTPFNEPYICAFFRGGNGTWPPYGITSGTFMQMLVPLIEGIRQTVKAIQEVRPEAQFWLNDGADGFVTSDSALQNLASELTQYRFLALDVLLGKADDQSWTAQFLSRHGVDPDWISGFVQDPVQLDVIGLDYYPGSEHQIFQPTPDRPASDWGRRQDYALDADPNPPGLGATLKLYFERYGKPVYVAETSSDRDQLDWLKYSVSEVARVRSEGVEVLAYTWWPLFDHIDWNSGLTRLTGHVCPSGLYHLQGDLYRTKGEARDAFALLTSHDPTDQGQPTFLFHPGVKP